jgi:hypothetical protein
MEMPLIGNSLVGQGLRKSYWRSAKLFATMLPGIVFLGVSKLAGSEL